MNLTAKTLGILIDAYTSTHCVVKTFSTSGEGLQELCDAGLIHPKDRDQLGERTTPAGDRVVEAALKAANNQLEDI